MGPLPEEPAGGAELQEALDEEEDNLADAQDMGDTRGEAVALLNIARIRLQQRHTDKALAAVREAKGLFREAEDKVGEAVALESIAEVWSSVSAYDKAVAAAERAREQMKRIGDEMGEARVLFLAAQNRVLPLNRRSSADEVTKATKTATELLNLCRKLGEPKALGSALCTMSQIDLHKEKFEDALAALEEALPLFTTLLDQQSMGSTLLMKARVHLAHDQLQKSLESVHKALYRFRRAQDEQGEQACLQLVAQLREFEFRVDGVAAPKTSQLAERRER